MSPRKSDSKVEKTIAFTLKLEPKKHQELKDFCEKYGHTMRVLFLEGAELFIKQAKKERGEK